jgi:tRNA-Thr(GGU) m(6)t(6)A37 methyltransferase TsaA
MTTLMTLQPIGFVRSPRRDVADDDWGDVQAVIELTPNLDPDALAGIEDFSHAEILFLFDRVPESAIERTARHPRNNPAWPRVGVFAQRGKNRPNRLGSTIVRIVERRGRALHVLGLDAVDGTPVLDIKPVMTEFLPREPVRQPTWSTELMRDYWQRRR